MASSATFAVHAHLHRCSRIAAQVHDVIEMAKQPPPAPAAQGMQPPKRKGKGKAVEPNMGVPTLKRTETLAIADVTASPLELACRFQMPFQISELEPVCHFRCRRCSRICP